ncbi:hypothetical protein GCM10022240_24550 [Microbacterium kribbense]|uniref:Low temperature requirement protein A n=1 Tax=Microbacterium kribbense TaxID=433645 RepID=A0ABP7GN89_9MICO
MSAEPEPPQQAFGRRVHWLELFFDLVMAAYIGQIALGLHGDPTWGDVGAFVVLLATAWWAWVNASITMNLFGARVTPVLWVAGTVAMMAIGLMAVAVPDALGQRAAAFAIGNAAIRLVWMTPWFIQRRRTGAVWWRPVLYNLLPAALWLVSIALPMPWQFVLWAAAVAVEMVLLGTIRRSGPWLQQNLDLDHMIERVNLLVVIVFGESVISIIAQLSEHWMPLPALCAALGFSTVALLAWIFFGHAVIGVERGLHRLQQAGSLSGLRDTVMYLPYLLVAGIVMLAAALGTAVADAAARLPLGVTLRLAAGIALFFVAAGAESLRYGAPWRDVVGWAPAGLVLPWLCVPLARLVPAWGVVAGALLVVAALTVLLTRNATRIARRRHA